MSDETERDAVLQRFVLPGRLLTFHSGGPLIEQNRSDVNAMADCVVRLERILAALREPSEGVVDAMMNWLVWTDGRYVKNALRAAVEAAEQEVGNE